MRWGVLLAAVLFFLSCGTSVSSALGFRCAVDADCDATTWCIANVCVERVDAGAKPGRYNTGVPRDVVLTLAGAQTVTQEGAVLDGLDIQGCVTIQANDVILRRSRIRCSSYYPLATADGVSGALFEDVEVDGLGFDDGHAVSGAGFTLRRANVHGALGGVQAQSGVLVDSSWIHDLVGAKVSGVSTDGAENLTVSGCNIELDGGVGIAVLMDTASGALEHVRVEQSWLSGGTYTVQVGGVGASDVEVNDNRFGRDASLGPMDLREGATASGNVYDDDNAPVNP